MEGFIGETDEPIVQSTAAVAVKKGDVSVVGRRESKSTWISVLYIRQQLVELEKQLDDFVSDDSHKFTCYIEGPPGSGKTCFLYHWARKFSIQKKKRVLIIQFREKASCFIWIRNSDGSLARMEKVIRPSGILSTVEGIIDKNEEANTPFDLCIHDGVVDGLPDCNHMLGSLDAAVVDDVIKKVVHVTSLSFSLSTGGHRLDDGGPITFLSLDSWSLQDYQDAACCAEFITQWKRFNTDGIPFSEAITTQLAPTQAADHHQSEGDATGSNDNDGDTTTNNTDAAEVVAAKYFYAGGSARFMFMFSLRKLRAELDRRMQSVTGLDWQFFAQRAVASTTPTAVNTLMQQFSGRCSPVSKYVLYHAYDKCKGQLVESVRAVALSTGNPVLRGWAFELEQIHLIRTCMDSKEEDVKYFTNGQGWSFRPDSQMEFDENNFSSFDMGPKCTVIWCLKWNQGCFDVAFFMGGALITVQFTVSAKHTLKPNYIRKLREALEKKSVDVRQVVHVGVRESDWEDLEFTLETVGTGRQSGEEAAEFDIHVRRSPKLKATPETEYACDFSDQKTITKLESVAMYHLGAKRSRGES